MIILRRRDVSNRPSSDSRINTFSFSLIFLRYVSFFARKIKVVTNCSLQKVKK